MGLRLPVWIGNPELVAGAHHGNDPGARADYRVDDVREERRTAAISGRDGRDVVRGENQPPVRRGVPVDDVLDGGEIVLIPPVEEIPLEQVQVDVAGVIGLAAAAATDEMPADGPLDVEHRAVERVGERPE